MVFFNPIASNLKNIILDEKDVIEISVQFGQHSPPGRVICDSNKSFWFLNEPLRV